MSSQNEGFWNKRTSFEKVTLVFGLIGVILIAVIGFSIAGLTGGVFGVGDSQFSITIQNQEGVVLSNTTYDIIGIDETLVLGNQTQSTAQDNGNFYIFINETGYYPKTTGVLNGTNNLITLYPIPDTTNFTFQIYEINGTIGAYDGSDLAGLDGDQSLKIKINAQELIGFGRLAYLPNATLDNSSNAFTLQSQSSESKYNSIWFGLNASFTNATVEGFNRAVFNVTINGESYNVFRGFSLIQIGDFDIELTNFDSTLNSNVDVICFDGNLDSQYNILTL